ncbi:hypothetical protein P4159_00425 [Bacillus thuringiensis]|uniref:PhrD n=1 Tax=Bacillus thuringiensis subsp. kurstaki TaxID=29339 RepID=Q0R5Z3_BACTK|nr:MULTISPECIES: hypothetical protein [Bacillus cereus group]AFU17206.1 PhrD [Bacillus thuringiensis MC28]MEB9963577.1 hypothetical protein [Bacillus cereus]ABH08744.1 PhrD [Bacillus thuringiensis serovar kurstaki]AGE81705.1 PhrD [Bacillus thuringiensis serovar kurstaki str. HD73]EJV73201.1 hypothetical protein IG1_05859 [Bacillus cereus HD73]
MKKSLLIFAIFTGFVSFSFSNNTNLQPVSKEKVDCVQYAHGETI